MNLLEKGNPEEEDFPMDDRDIRDDVDGKETGVQADKKTILIVALVFIILILLILLFSVWYRSQKKVSNAEAVNQEIAQYVENQNTENNSIENNTSVENKTDAQGDLVLPGTESETAIVVEEAKEHKEVDVLLNPDKFEDPLDQDMYYEDYSYEKEYIMKELAGWWNNSGTGAIYDLSALRRYRKLSYGLQGTKQFYYYGDTDAEGNPNGEGVALYADDTYYFGSFSHGKRDGNGYWMRFYYNNKHPYSMNGKITMHSYAGEWKNDLPNGNGQEHFDIDVSKLVENDEFYQNIIGGFVDGRYQGDMYANTINEKGEITEWDGEAENGIFALKDSLPASGDHPVWKSRSDEPRFRRIGKDDNKDCGIRELYLEEKQR